MTTIATGVNKLLKYKVESTWGTVPSASSSQALRRVTSTLNLKKQTYESNEIAPTFQRSDFRHGVRSVEGSITGEVSPGTYKDFMAAAVRRAFTSVAAITGASITIAGSGPSYTVTRAAGSFLTDGIKIGYMVRLTAGAFNAANLNKNLFVIAVTATVLTVLVLNSSALVAEGPIASATVTTVGKVTFVPSSGHTDLSYSIEHYHQDLVLSEVYSGCKINQMNVQLPASGMATLQLDFMGKDETTAGAEYFTSPIAASTSGILAAVNGIMVSQGTAIAVLTGMNIQLAGSMTAEAVVGSNTYPDIAEGRILVSGQATALFTDATLRDDFLNETEVSLQIALSTSGLAAADFVTLTLPRVKFGGADKDDGDKSIAQTLPFTALYNVNGGAGVQSEQTTLQIQDSLA